MAEPVPQTLTAAASRLCGLLCRNMGWRPCDFWAATPAEIATIYQDESDAVRDGISRSELENLMEQDRNG